MRRLEAHEIPLHDVFSSRYAFSIPDYQRPYAWGTEQAEQLLDDLVEALDRGESEPYFLGSIVLVKDENDPASDVIDGQQHLTTLTILLAVLRDLPSDPGLKKELDEHVREPGNILRQLDPVARLVLRERDRTFFAQHVQTSDGIRALAQLDRTTLATDAQRAIRDNAAALLQRLEPCDESERTRLAQMLATRTFLVVVSTPDLDSAHRIFSVMNARGLDLSPADIFKSKVIGELGSDQAEYADRWEAAEEILGRDGFADLFVHVRMIFAKERARKELLQEFEEQVLGAFLPERAREFVDDVLVPYADAYRQLRDRSYTAAAEAEAVNASPDRLAQVDNNDWRPPALWALHHKGDDPAWLDAFLRALERLAASMLIRRAYATPRATRYAAVLRALEAGAGLGAEALKLTTEEKRETTERLGGEIYQVNAVRKFVLLRLDEVLAGQPRVSYHHRIITIEHVLPQTLADDSHWLADFSDEERAHWTHRLVNLVLLNRSRNSAVQNYSFERQENAYFKSGNGVAAFALTTQVLAEQSWPPEVLAERQAALSYPMATAWDLN